jgi:hypothetical protein
MTLEGGAVVNLATMDEVRRCYAPFLGGESPVRSPAVRAASSRDGLTVHTDGSEPPNRWARGPSFDAVFRWHQLPWRTAARIDATRAATLCHVRHTFFEARAVSPQAERLVASISGCRNVRDVPFTAERELYYEAAAHLPFRSQTPYYPAELIAAVRQRRVYAAAAPDKSLRAPIRGWRGTMRLRWATRDTDAAWDPVNPRRPMLSWVADVGARWGQLGRGYCGCVFVQAEALVEKPLRLWRGRQGIARARLYGFAMPLHSRLLPAVDAPVHPAGLLRGTVDAHVCPPGGAAVVATSAELDMAMGRLRGRWYASVAAQLPAWLAGADHVVVGGTVGWAIVPPQRRERSRFADEVHLRRIECSFPLWAFGGGLTAADLGAAVRPRCGLVWEVADVTEDV